MFRIFQSPILGHILKNTGGDVWQQRRLISEKKNPISERDIALHKWADMREDEI
jgi:hypothetical protein